MQINMGNFGNRVADPSGGARVDPRASGVEVAAAVEGVANQQINFALQEKKKQDEQKEMAARAREVALRNETIDKLADLHDEVNEGIRTGTLPKDEAEQSFNDRSRELIGATAPQFRQQSRELAVSDLNNRAGRLGNGVRKAREQRDRQDVTADMDSTLERLQRQYRVDPARTNAEAEQLISTLGPYSTMTPDQRAKKLQSFKETTQFAVGSEAVSAGRDSKSALRTADKVIDNLTDITPQQRVTLKDRVSAYGMAIDQRAELDAQRAAREQERRLRVAEAEFTTFQTLADKGTVLDPAYIDRALQTTAGTPYQAGIKGLAEQARAVGGFAGQTIASQRAALDAVDQQIAKQGRTPELDKRRSQLEKVWNGSMESARADPMRAGLERGVVTELAPLDITNPRTLVAGLSARLVQQQRVSVWAGDNVSPLTATEAGQVRDMLAVLPVKERSQTIAMLATTIGPSASVGLAKQLDKNDKGLGLAFAYAADATSPGTNMFGTPQGSSRFVSELILKGETARKDGTSTKGEKQADTKPAQWSRFVTNELEGVYPSPLLTENTRDAAILIAHGIAAEAGGQLSDNDLERAVRLAVGGSLVEHNGRKIPLPAGVGPDMLDTRLRSVTPQEIQQQAPGDSVRVAGVQVPTSEWVKTLPGAELSYAGPGKYYVLVGGRPVTSADGKRRIAIGVNQ